jgi:hypothetical protein
MSVHGEYHITIDTPNGPIQAEASVELEGHDISGEMHANGNTAEITNGHFDGGAMTWDTHVSSPSPMDLHFAGHCEDDVCSVISGKVEAGALGAFPFKGTRA